MVTCWNRVVSSHAGILWESFLAVFIHYRCSLEAKMNLLLFSVEQMVSRKEFCLTVLTKV